MCHVPFRAPAHSPRVRTPMRIFPLFAFALATTLASGPLRAATADELVVGLAPPRPQITAAVERARFAERLSALGLVARGTLADGLGLTRFSASPAAAGTRRNPFDLDPARVWRVAARDSIAAEADAAALAQDPRGALVESHQTPAVRAAA